MDLKTFYQVEEPQSGESHRPLTPILLEKYRDTPPISIAIFWQNMPSSWQNVLYTPPICITIRLPFVSRYFFRSIRVRGRWNTPNLNQYIFNPDISKMICSSEQCCLDGASAVKTALSLWNCLERSTANYEWHQTLRAQILKKIKILKFSSELEIFKRATHEDPIFCGEFGRSGLKISSEIENFKRSWIFSRFGPLGEFAWISASLCTMHPVVKSPIRKNSEKSSCP